MYYPPCKDARDINDSHGHIPELVQNQHALTFLGDF